MLVNYVGEKIIAETPFCCTTCHVKEREENLFGFGNILQMGKVVCRYDKFFGPRTCNNHSSVRSSRQQEFLW